MIKNLMKLLKDEEGATALEYGLIAAAIAGVIITVVYMLGGNIEQEDQQRRSTHLSRSSEPSREGGSVWSNRPIGSARRLSPADPPSGSARAWASSGPSVCDLRWRRIPNAVSRRRARDGAGHGGFTGGIRARCPVWRPRLILLVVLYRPWRRGRDRRRRREARRRHRRVGGLGSLPWFALATLLAGGVVAVVCYLLARAPARAEVRANLIAGRRCTATCRRLRRSRIAKVTVLVPYAIAIAAGAAVALLRWPV